MIIVVHGVSVNSVLFASLWSRDLKLDMIRYLVFVGVFRSSVILSFASRAFARKCAYDIEFPKNFLKIYG